MYVNRKKYPQGSGPTGKGRWKLYHSATLRSARCLWLIEEMGVSDDFETVEYSPYSASPQEKEDYKRNIHPHGLVPAMVTTEGDVMIESAAICMYLAEVYGRCLPDEANKALYYTWCINAATADAPLDAAFYEQKKEEKDRDFQKIEINNQKCRDWLENLEKLLSQRSSDCKFICGHGFTAADAIIGYSVYYASFNKTGKLLKKCPNVRNYLASLRARPLWEKGMGSDAVWQ